MRLPLALLLLLLLVAPSTPRGSSKKGKRGKAKRSAQDLHAAAGAEQAMPAEGSCEHTRYGMAQACTGVDAKLLEHCAAPECLAAMQAIADRQVECQEEWPEETAKMMPMMIKACENDTPVRARRGQSPAPPRRPASGQPRASSRPATSTPDRHVAVPSHRDLAAPCACRSLRRSVSAVVSCRA